MNWAAWTVGLALLAHALFGHRSTTIAVPPTKLQPIAASENELTKLDVVE